MKKTLLIISISSIIFLTGCGGIFNLNGWIWPEDDLEFMAMVERLKTPQEIGDYMWGNFIYETHAIYAPDPYALWKIKKGDCNDFATFGVFVAHWHGHETYQIKIYYSGTIKKHWIAVYVEEENKMSFTDSQYYFNNYGYFFDTFREIVEFDCKYFPDKELKKYIVRDYENNIVEEGYK